MCKDNRNIRENLLSLLKILPVRTRKYTLTHWRILSKENRNEVASKNQKD